MQRLYPTHVRTTPAQKVLLGASNAILGLLDPERGEHIAALGEVMQCGQLQRMRRAMHSDVDGRAVLAERPDASLLDVSALLQLPESSFGGSYARFMHQHGFLPSERPPVRYVDDAELAYIMQRYRMNHDYWHVLFGLPQVGLAEEVGLKCVELLQTGLPMTALAAFAGPLRLSWAERAQLVTRVLPWAAANASSTVNLMSVYYEKHFQEDIDDFRRSLGIKKWM